MVKSFFSTALMALLSTVLLQADEAKLSVRTLALESFEVPEWFVAVDGEQHEALEWPTRQPSPAVMLKAGKELLLYSKQAGEGEEAGFVVVNKIAIPEGANEVLLLMSPPTEEGDPVITAIADTFAKATFNEWILINLSKQAVMFSYGKDNEPLEIDAGEGKVYAIDKALDKGAPVTASVMMGDEMKKFYSTYWSAPADQRSLVLFYDDGDRVKLRKILDFLPKKK